MSHQDNIHVVPATGTHTATVILLHGLGGQWTEYLSLTQPWRSSMSHIKWIFPQAAGLPVTVNNGYAMPAWYDVYEFGAAGRDDEAGMINSKGVISQIISDEISNGVPSDRIVLGGFSQGCAMTYLVGLTYEQKLGGLICLSGRLPVQRKWESGDWKVSLHVKLLPIFWGHGTGDNLVKFTAQGKEAVRVLTSNLGVARVEKPGPGIYIKEYRGMGHTIDTEEELPDIKEWLEKILPATA